MQTLHMGRIPMHCSHYRKKGPCKAIRRIRAPALNYRLVWVVLLGIISSWGITLHVTICHLQRSKQRPKFLQKQKGHTSCQVLSMFVKVCCRRGEATQAACRDGIHNRRWEVREIRRKCFQNRHVRLKVNRRIRPCRLQS